MTPAQKQQLRRIAAELAKLEDWAGDCSDGGAEAAAQVLRNHRHELLELAADEPRAGG